MKLVYINAGDSSVMEAQVLELLKYYHNQHGFQLTLLQGCKNTSECYAIEKKLSSFSFLKVVWFKTYPNYTLYKYLAQNALNKVLRQECTSDFFIHTRGELYGSYAKIFLQKNKLPLNLLVDIRGVRIDEVMIYMQKNAILKHNKISCYERAYYRLKSHIPAEITVVSDAAKRYFINKYGFEARLISVHPNIAGEQFLYSKSKRLEIRDKLHISPNTPIAICSSNGNAAWQKDKLLMEQLVEKGITVLNLSPVVVNLDGVISLKVSFKEMPDYLSAADYAVLWRDVNPVNETASPSKMSEFACMGLYVIHNGTVDIATEYISDTGAGVILKSNSQLDEINLPIITDSLRQKWSEAGCLKFGIKEIANDYVNRYLNYESIDCCKQ